MQNLKSPSCTTICRLYQVFQTQPLRTFTNSITTSTTQRLQHLRSQCKTSASLSSSSANSSLSLSSTSSMPSLHHAFHTSTSTSSPEAATSTSSSTAEPPSIDLPTAETLATPSPKVKQIIKMMLDLTFIEAHQMVKFMEKEYGIAPMAMSAAAPGPGGAAAGAAAEAVEEEAPVVEEKKEEVKKTSFNVKLDGFDAKDKIKIIKEVRAATGLGLKESKELVEAAPKVVKANLSQADCDALIAKLKEAGAKVSIE